MKSLAEITAEVELVGDGGLDMICSDLGITYAELYEAAEVAVARSLGTADAEEIEFQYLLAGAYVQGVFAGILYARKRTEFTWVA